MQELRLFSAEELAGASAPLAHTFGEAHKAGLPADAALRGAGEKFADMVMERAGAIADAMEQQGPAAAQRRRSGEAELAAQWGEALRLHYMATLAAAELGVLSVAVTAGRRHILTAAKRRWPGCTSAPARPPSKSMPCCPPAIPAGPTRGCARCMHLPSQQR